MLKSIVTALVVFYFQALPMVAQSYQTCLVTNLEHWGLKGQTHHGTPDYFTMDSLWSSQVRGWIDSLLTEKYNVSDVQFFHPGVAVKDVYATSDEVDPIEVDRGAADLFVQVYSDVSYERIIAIEVIIENKSGKRIHKRKCQVILKPQSDPERIETDVDIGKEDFKAIYRELLGAAFRSGKRKQNLGERSVSRVQTHVFDEFLTTAFQCNMSESTDYHTGHVVEFLNTGQRVNVSIKGKNERVNESDGITGDKEEKRGAKIIRSDLHKERWKVKYKLDRKKPLIFWNRLHFEAQIMTENNDVLGRVDVFEKDTLAVSLGRRSVLLNWVYDDSIVEIYENQRFVAFAQMPYNFENYPIKFYFSNALKKEEVGELISLFLLNKALMRL